MKIENWIENWAEEEETNMNYEICITKTDSVKNFDKQILILPAFCKNYEEF